MLSLVWLVPALPLAGVLLLLVGGRRLGDPLAGWLATTMMVGSFGVAVVTFIGLLDRAEEDRQFVFHLFPWIGVGRLSVGADLLVDPLSVAMILFITGVGALIHLYSIGYMQGDARYPTFFLYLNLFAFSMLVLVLGDNLLMTFLGWEGVGACSYWLISFWFTDEANAVAGKKAFVTNRIGDWGFMVATFVTFQALGTLTYSGSNGIIESASGLTVATATAIAALLFVGACGKSAQLPLYVWLPDAMAGPTPVSALIHAATMVTSGVYLMTRISPVLAVASHWVPDAIALIGALTALYAATIAVSQRDIKKVLAYSTISQLGYMFLAVGSGAYVAAIFHMITHAFFKALLFLGAGSVIHGMHHEQDMRVMGGLRKYMRVTCWTFIVGWLAIAGVFPLSGFWSKDEILMHTWENSPALWAIGLITTLLTAYYMSRQVFMVFGGEERFDEHEVHPHESPWTMTVPLVVLAVAAAFGGIINLPFSPRTELLGRWLHPVVEAAEVTSTASTALKVTLALVASAAALTGIVVAYLVYIRKRIEAVEPDLLLHAYHVDEAIGAFVGGPGRAAAAFTADVVDREVIDGAVNGVGTLVREGGSHLRVVQTGYVRTYALGIAGGAVLLLGWFISRAGF